MTTIRLKADSSLKDEAIGGVTTALVSLPSCMAYGILAFAPLGDAFTGYSVLMGLWGGVVLSLVLPLFRGTPSLMSAPKTISVLIVAEMLAGVAGVLGEVQPALMLCAAMIMIALSGVFESVIGLMRAGRIVKYVPYPVISGLVNGSAVLIIAGQLWTMLGIESDTSFWAHFLELGSVEWLALSASLVTILAMAFGSKVSIRVPAAIVAILLGTGVYYLVHTLAPSAGERDVIGAIPGSLPDFSFYGAVGELLTHDKWSAIQNLILQGAISLAVVNALMTLVTGVSIEELSGQKSKGDRDLIGEGCANFVAGALGAVPGCGTLSRSVTNMKSGGQDRRSVFVSGLTLLSCVLLLSPLVGVLPRVTLAAVLTVTAFQSFDGWSLRLARGIPSARGRQRKTLMLNLGISLLVMAMMMAFGVFPAVLGGIFLSMVMFVISMSRSIIRRSFNAKRIRSTKVRSEEELDILRDNGERILVFELEGALFFGSAESLAAKVEELVVPSTRFVVLDLRRVNDVDSTGARIIEKLVRLLGERRDIVLSHVERGSSRWSFFRQMGILKVVPESRIFPDVDYALEYCENRLIAEERSTQYLSFRKKLSEVDLLIGLSREEVAAVQSVLVERSWEPTQIVFPKGSPGNKLYMIASGEATVSVPLHGEGSRHRRLVTFGPGNSFGEMSLIDGSPRSAEVVATQPLHCWVLSRKDYELLTQKFPRIATKLLERMCRNFSARMRQANEMITQLEK